LLAARADANEKVDSEGHRTMEKHGENTGDSKKQLVIEFGIDLGKNILRFEDSTPIFFNHCQTIVNTEVLRHIS